MSVFRTDKRQVVASEVPGADDRMADRAAQVRELQLAMGRDLAKVEDTAHFVLRGCGSMEEYGGRFGLDPEQTRALLNLARLEDSHPQLIEAVKGGNTDAERAGLAAKVLVIPGAVKEGDDWLAWVEDLTRGRLAWRVDRRLEELRQAPEKVSELNLVVSRQAKEDFARARVLASKKAGKALSKGQTFGVVVDDYLERYDEDRKKPRPRRKENTEDDPDSRYIPAEVRREVRKRSGGCCEFPGCNHEIWLYYCHLTPHAAGGCREVYNVVHFCGRHHFMLDVGIIKLIEGDANAPVFEVDGKRVAKSRAPPGASNGPPPSRGKPIDPVSDQPPDVVRERTRWPAPGHARVRLRRSGMHTREHHARY
ncbi:MAG: hypothetical protein QNJ98_06160 [Planctomycetota bacterium]|nr:hypothetical protein [Planctomycetota bacterium]